MHKVVLRSGSIIRVQTWDSEALAPSSVEERLGVAWPRKIGAVASGTVDILCVAPTDWLVLTPDPDIRTWFHELGAAFQGSAFRATNVSHALVRIEIKGPELRDLLAKGSSLDLYPPVFPPGRSARTRFAGVPVIVRCVRHATFELIVTLSYADYLMAWLEDAELEFTAIP